MRPCARTTLALAWLLLAPACKPTPKPAPSPAAGAGAGDLDKKFFVPAGKFAEINLQMPAQSEALADYVVEDGGTIEWNVHAHPAGEEEKVFDEGDGPKGSLAFRAPEEGAYSYLFENKKGKKAVVLRVRLTLSGGARVTSTVPSP